MCIDTVSLPGCTIFLLWVDNAGMGNIVEGRDVGLLGCLSRVVFTLCPVLLCII